MKQELVQVNDNAKAIIDVTDLLKLEIARIKKEQTDTHNSIKERLRKAEIAF